MWSSVSSVELCTDTMLLFSPLAREDRSCIGPDVSPAVLARVTSTQLPPPKIPIWVHACSAPVPISPDPTYMQILQCFDRSAFTLPAVWERRSGESNAKKPPQENQHRIQVISLPSYAFFCAICLWHELQYDVRCRAGITGPR